MDGLATPPAAFIKLPESDNGLATPSAASTELPDNPDGSNSPVVSEGNIVLQESTMQASRDNPTAQVRAMPPSPAQNMTPTSRARSKKRKFYVVIRGRRTGVFDNWWVD